LTALNFKDQEPGISHFISDNTNKTQLFSTQVDYNHKKNKVSFDMGGKYSYVNTSTGLLFFDNEHEDFSFRPEKSSDFDYTEHNIAGYGSASYGWSQWSIKAGLRAEYTKLKGVVSEPKDFNADNYLELFPTFYLQYETKNQSQWGFSYGK